jgi:hypothetical protein
MHNDFTYGHSDLPPVRPEIKAEIVGLSAQIANLTLEIQGNYRELEELAEMLDNSLDSCQLNLNAIRIADDSRLQSISLTDLPTDEKQLILSGVITSIVAMILSAVITSTVPIKVLVDIFGFNVDFPCRSHG